MYLEAFQRLGLSKNEGEIYETLLREGDLSVGEISLKSKVHRRNVYDTIHRMLEKGLVFEILQRRENRYQAVAPQKLMEFIEDKRRDLTEIMPGLEKLYKSTPQEEQVYIYRGVEGWKNYIREIIELGEDLYTLGGKGSWTHPSLHGFLKSADKEFVKKGIHLHFLLDSDSEDASQGLFQLKAKHSTRYLPLAYSTKSTLDIYSDRVVVLSHVAPGMLDEDSSFSVIVNRTAADSFRVWFDLMWSISSEKAQK